MTQLLPAIISGGTIGGLCGLIAVLFTNWTNRDLRKAQTDDTELQAAYRVTEEYRKQIEQKDRELDQRDRELGIARERAQKSEEQCQRRIAELEQRAAKSDKTELELRRHIDENDRALYQAQQQIRVMEMEIQSMRTSQQIPRQRPEDLE